MVAAAGAGALLLVAPSAPSRTSCLSFQFSSTPWQGYIKRSRSPHVPPVSTYPVGSPSEPWPQRPTKPGKWCVNESHVNRTKRRKKKQECCIKSRHLFFFLTADAHAARHRFGGEVRRKRSEMPTRRRNRMTPLAAIFRGSSLFFFTQGVEDGFQHINGVIDDERSEP